jgi:uncharacterized SAM-binding protein YcdF (DUF218 family)
VRIAVKVVAVALVVGLLYLVVTMAQVWVASHRDEAQEAQAIVVLGAAQYNGRPSPVLRRRLDHAVDLYRHALAKTIVVTGGRQEGDAFTEATASANYLHSKGVPDRDLLREVSGHSSWESLSSTAAFLRQRNIRQVLLVSDPLHSYRVKAIAKELGLVAFASPASNRPGGLAAVRYLSRETVAVAVGRLIGFHREAKAKVIVLGTPGSGPAARLAGPSGVV